MKKICQSCSTVLIQGKADYRGTELKGERSDKYCNRCYLNGKFQNPDMTLEQMIEQNAKAVTEAKMGKFKKWLFLKSQPKILKNLERWRNGQ